MLETPRMKLVKINADFIKDIPELNMNDIFKDFIARFPDAVEEAKDKIIEDFAEEENLSLKCARYFINRHFKFEVHVDNSTGLHETPIMSVVLLPKSLEEILRGIDDEPDRINECERELLEKHSNDKWEWVK